MYVYKTDVATLAALRPNMIHTLLQTGHGLVTPSSLERSSYGVLMQDNKVICGIAHVHVKDDVHWIEGMCMRDTHRHRGLGSEMLDLITSELAGAQAKTAVLRDVPTHDLLVMFYTKRGFVEKGITETHTTLDFCE